LKISKEKLTVERLTWDAASSSYTLLKTERFTRTATGWTSDQA
jgi:hypothetical protein